MKAVRYEAHGGPEQLKYVEVPDPVCGPLDVVVRVGFTALNHLDLLQRSGMYTMVGFHLPHIPGMDVSGVVDEVGDAVSGIRQGDRVVLDPSLSGVPEGAAYAGRGDLQGDLAVVGATVDGGYAERCLAPSSHVHLIPPDVSLERAVVFPTCWMTACHGLFEVGGLKAGETVLIHAAGSGVSSAAIQLAAAAGARVLATAGSEAKCARGLKIGAEATANNRSEDVVSWARQATDGRGVDMVLDHVGAALWEASIFSLAPGGRLVTCGNTTGDRVDIPSLGHFYHFGLSVLGSDPYRHEEFAPAWANYCKKGFSAEVDSIMPLEAASEAHSRLAAGEAFGKILLRP